MKKILFTIVFLLVTVTQSFAGMAEDREAFFDRLINTNIIQKIETRTSTPKVYVMPRFYELNFDDKASFINVVWAYHMEKNNDQDQQVQLYDSRTGKHVGGYSGFWGLVLR